MTGKKDNATVRNFVLVALLAAVLLFTAFHEGYLGSIAVPFWILLAAAFAICTWLALSISSRRLLSLLLAVFILEYVKEAIGIRSKLWVYHGAGGQFNFGVWASGARFAEDRGRDGEVLGVLVLFHDDDHCGPVHSGGA